MPALMHTAVSAALVSATLFATLALSGCAPKEPTAAVSPAASRSATDNPSTQPTASPSASGRGTVVFDMGHGEIFSADDTSELGQSKAIERIKANGFDVVINRDTITDEDLRGAVGLILAGPMQPLTEAEYAATQRFVERGGTLLLTIHVPFPVAMVPAHWGLPVGEEVMVSSTPADPQKAGVFFTERVFDDPLTKGVKRILVVAGWPLATTNKSAQIVLATPENVWLAPRSDANPEPAAPGEVGSYAVVGVNRMGKGQVIVSGDDGIFANIAIDQADNAKLLDNIIKAMQDALAI